MLARDTLYTCVVMMVAWVCSGVDVWQMRQRLFRTGLCATWVVPLHETLNF